MPSLTDKLKSLGVTVGAEGIQQPDKEPKYPIEEVVPDGNEVDTPFGNTFVINELYPADPRKPDISLEFEASLVNLSTWIGDPYLVKRKPSSFAFLDTETSGLAGGTGTYAFLIGVGRFNNEGFQLNQIFLRDPYEEPAQLAALQTALADCEVLVTFNGKSFDIPLLNSRFITNGELPPLTSYTHIDLLHIARRIWRDRLESRTLGSIETNILDLQRTEEDIPGWMVPTIYFDYLKSGDARPVTQVLYHNAMDIISLSTLLNRVSIMLDDPQGGMVEDGIDLISIAKIFEDLGEFNAAAVCFERGLNNELPEKVRKQAFYRWSIMEKRRENIETSIELWHVAADHNEIYAHEELAKVFEHRTKEYAEAIHWTELALEIVSSPEFPVWDREIWKPKLEHRLKRLQRKISSSKS